MGLIARYPSLVTPGKLVYATGDGSTETPSVCEFVLPQTGSYLLFVNYIRAFEENGISLSFETSHPCIPGEWFTLRDQSDQSGISITLEGNEGSELAPGDEAKYRLFLSPLSNMAIGASENGLRVSIVGAGSPGGFVTLRLVSASRPAEIPHLVPGFETTKTGSLQVTLSGDGGEGGWKLYHETEYRNSGDVLTGLGVGKQLVTFKEVEGSAPEDVLVEVAMGETSLFEAEYTS